MALTPELLASVSRWIDEDPDPATAAELRQLVETAQTDDGGPAGRADDGGAAGTAPADDSGAAAAAAELADRFSGPLVFGTAGLRAALGGGPNRMNRAVVRRTADGLAAFLLDTAAGHYVPRAVVGYDARHNSDVFARDTAAVLTAAGIETFLMPDHLPTPVLAWAVRALDCEAGVMVTASHNPPQDNGYKVYLGGRAVRDAGQGAQIVAPYDAEIARRIPHHAPLRDIALAESGWTVLPGAGEAGDVQARYIADVAALSPSGGAPRDLRIVLTPLHGVGGDTMVRTFAAAGFEDVRLVEAQSTPDPDFPTVAFPNPEEPGAMDLALEAARAQDADLVIANDPDADRCAVALDIPGTGWRMLRGDEVGALLGEHVAARLSTGPGRADSGSAAPVFASSIVSSRQLARIAAAHGIEHRSTLTGFKWISRVPGLAYGYEEALGYCVAPELVRDKDGVSAALLVAEYAAELKAAGRSLADALDELALAHGVHATDQLSIRVGSLDLLGEMMGRLRAAPPAVLGGSPVATAVDLSAEDGPLPPTDGLEYTTQDGSRAVVRPSGTEPKLKCYLEVVAPVPGTDAHGLRSARSGAAERLARIRADLESALGL